MLDMKGQIDTDEMWNGNWTIKLKKVCIYTQDGSHNMVLTEGNVNALNMNSGC